MTATTRTDSPWSSGPFSLETYFFSLYQNSYGTAYHILSNVLINRCYNVEMFDRRGTKPKWEGRGMKKGQSTTVCRNIYMHMKSLTEEVQNQSGKEEA